MCVVYFEDHSLLPGLWALSRAFVAVRALERVYAPMLGIDALWTKASSVQDSIDVRRVAKVITLFCHKIQQNFISIVYRRGTV